MIVGHENSLSKRLGRPPRRVAVFRALQLGDLLCTVPALRALRAALPNSEITLVGLPWARAFVERFSCYLDNFLEFPGYPGLPELEPRIEEFPSFLAAAQRAQFDLAIQLHGSGSSVNPLTVLLGARRTAGFFVPGEYCPDPELFLPYPGQAHEIHRYLRLLEFIGVPPKGDELEFPITAQDRQELAAVVAARQLRVGQYICIHPGSRYLTRRWPVERFAAVADALAARGWQIVLTGSAAEQDLAQELSRAMSGSHINLAGQTSLGALAVLLSAARLLVSNDTGVSHIACAHGTPSVLVVLGSDPHRWAPLDRDRHVAVFEPVDCRPCSHFICPIGHPCATAVTPERVLAQVDRLLKQYCGAGEQPKPAGDSMTTTASRNLDSATGEGRLCVDYVS